MIKNDRQYEYTRRRLEEFAQDLRAIQEKYASDPKKQALLSQGYREHIAQLKAEMAEYEKVKTTELPKVLHAESPLDISRLLVQLRIARHLTQEELAARVGCKQSDIARLEREDYQGYTLNQLKKLAACLDAKIELDVIPVERPKAA